MIENPNYINQEFNRPTKQHQCKEKTQNKVLEFFGKSQECIVCLVGIINSTELITQIPESKLNVFFATFLNCMADVVKKHNGKIVKSMKSTLLFYFDDSEKDYVRNALWCGLDMVEKRDEVNERLQEISAPFINYRVSSDFGRMMIGYSDMSTVEDIFGPVVNMCSKINPLASPNSMVIGNDFHMIVKSSHDFEFNKMREKPITGIMNKYSVYEVKKA